MIKEKIGKLLIIFISLVSIVAIFFVDPIKQDLAYHQFVDSKSMFGVPNFWNVVSNVPFFLVGIYALMCFNRMKLIAEMGVAYWLFFFGVSMVAFGSGYYHILPNNETLVWDRLPMTVAFMSLFAIIISEFIDARRGALLLIPFILLGVFSVFYWQWTESNGAGDLRFYALVQFLPIVLIPVILLFYPTRFVNITGYWLLLLAYVIAKLFENFDAVIFEITGGIISGHSIKHVIAAIGVMFLFINYKNRIRIYLPND